MAGAVVTASAGETEALGTAFAARLRPGDVVLLRGEMGAGKTTFVRGVLRGLGLPADRAVTSPTYTLARRYDDLGVPVSHLDLHRVGGLDEHLEDELAPDRITLVEWPGDLAGAHEVLLEHVDPGHRRVVLP